MRAEPLLQLGVADAGVLDHVVQHAGGDDLVRVVAAAQELRDFQRMQDERRLVGRPALPRVPRRRELERAARDRQVLDEGREVHRRVNATRCLARESADRRA